jgi:hypothetical protein
MGKAGVAAQKGISDSSKNRGGCDSSIFIIIIN